MTRSILLAALMALALTACGEQAAEETAPVDMAPAAEVVPEVAPVEEAVPAEDPAAVPADPAAEVAPGDVPAPETPAAEAAN